MNEKMYISEFTHPLISIKSRKKRAKHPIFIYTRKSDDMIGDDFEKLNQIVNVYEHTLDDFVTNSFRIIKHYKRSYGDPSLSIYTLGQSIRFRVHPNQEPIDLPLFKFFTNYTMLIVPILMGVNMSDWHPFVPPKFTSKAWVTQLNRYIKMSRPYGNARQICELIEWSKFLMNQFVEIACDRIGLSISNNDFLEVAKRSKYAYESMSCSYPIPKNIEPSELEAMNSARTSKFLDIISNQRDLPISVYTRNGLFNPGQFREFAVHIGYKPDLYGNTIPFTSNTNIMMGLNDPRAFMVDAAGGRKAEMVKLNVSDAGALERSLCMLMSDVRFVDIEYECDSKHFRVRHIDNIDILDKLEGRVCTLDPKSNEYLIVDPDDTTLVGKTIYLKTPITCTHPRRHEGIICSACYGKMMAHLNCDIHIGRIAALNSADDMEQQLLSAKHALATNTNDVKFDSMFDTYFDMASCQISFNGAMLDMSTDSPEEFKHLHLEFYLATMKKLQDGEGRHYDRYIPNIVVYDDRDDTRTVISEDNGIPIFLSPEFNNYFLDAAKHVDDKGIVRIPFTELIDSGTLCCEVLFEYQYRNNELAGALLELEGILTNGTNINQFSNYDECLNRIIPLFIRGGIHLPELQTELLISKMIYDPEDGSVVDWTLENPSYRFYSIDKSIQNSTSMITSILYHESSRQIAGAYNTYNKSGTSGYDWFLADV